jgi:hypothetical protein
VDLAALIVGEVRLAHRAVLVVVAEPKAEAVEQGRLGKEIVDLVLVVLLLVVLAAVQGRRDRPT